MQDRDRPLLAGALTTRKQGSNSNSIFRARTPTGNEKPGASAAEYFEKLRAHLSLARAQH